MATIYQGVPSPSVIAFFATILSAIDEECFEYIAAVSKLPVTQLSTVASVRLS